MSLVDFLVATEVPTGMILRARVRAVREDGAVLIDHDVDGRLEVACDILQTSNGPGLHLDQDNEVLVWVPRDDEKPGVVLGRIGPGQATQPEAPGATPDEIVLEAKKSLTLKCGEGSITMRADGKILIKGKDLVSRAQRTNRIKGGAVAIN
jgi:hypothetical protein